MEEEGEELQDRSGDGKWGFMGKEFGVESGGDW